MTVVAITSPDLDCFSALRVEAGDGVPDVLVVGCARGPLVVGERLPVEGVVVALDPVGADVVSPSVLEPAPVPGPAVGIGDGQTGDVSSSPVCTPSLNRPPTRGSGVATSQTIPAEAGGAEHRIVAAKTTIAALMRTRLISSYDARFAPDNPCPASVKHI
jgi:hypothetical protein